MENVVTFTSKLGSFSFEKGVILSRAKLIRDSITGQFFAPKPNEPAIRTGEDVTSFVRYHLGGALAEIPFELHSHLIH